MTNTICPHCGGSELRKSGIYYGKTVTTRRYQCKSCKSYFGIDISSKVNENQTNTLADNNQEEK